MSFLEREEEDVRNIFGRFKNRNFKGTEGQAIKNSSFQFATILIAKIGALLFTILIARMLMPELFGLYTLALSTIVLFASFSDLGVGAALITFVSKSLGRGKAKKAKAYFKQLTKYKFYLVILSSIILVSLAYWVSNTYYNKPIFFALLVGGLYLPIVSFISFFEGLYKANNNFKFPLIKEIIVQCLRLILAPLGIFFFLRAAFSNSAIVAGVILILVFCYACALFVLTFFSRKKLGFLKSAKQKLTKKETKHLHYFILPLTATALSGVFFGYIDTIMLGHFVTEEFIGYYGAAFSLIASAAAIISFAGIALFPIFSRLKGSVLEKAFKKTRNLTFLISIAGALVAFFFAPLIIKIIYGVAYSPSIVLLKIFALLLIVLPLTGIYDSYFISQERTKVLAILLIVSTIINVVLNYFFITFGLTLGMDWAVMGACVATVISRYIYLFGLGLVRKKRYGGK